MGGWCWRGGRLFRRGVFFMGWFIGGRNSERPGGGEERGRVLWWARISGLGGAWGGRFWGWCLGGHTAADCLACGAYDGGDAAADSGECAPVADVLGADCGGGAAVLSFDRGQDRAFSGEDAAPVLSGARRGEYPRRLHQWYCYESADGRA